MENYTVSARKYRPKDFSSVIGQAHITGTLKNANKNNHLAHAFLFCGQRGVGKTTCARILAKTINCRQLGENGEACNQCESCKNFNEQRSFNIYELDAASNNSVEDIRNLTNQVRIPPHSGKYKVYIIDEVHMLSQSAFNAFLKTLEEPPSYAIFILATTEKQKILPTILSRCQIFDFKRIQYKDIVRYLKEISKKQNVEPEEEALYLLAQKADGAMRDALSLFDRVLSFSGNKLTYQDVVQNLSILDYDYFFKAVDHIIQQDTSQSLLLFSEVLDKGFDGRNYLSGLSSHFRNLLVCKDPATLPLLEVAENTRERYLEQSKQLNLSFILSALNILNQFEINYKSSNNQRLHTELALLKVCHIPDALDLGKDAKITEESKKKAPPVNKGAKNNQVQESTPENNHYDTSKEEKENNTRVTNLNDIQSHIKEKSRVNNGNTETETAEKAEQTQDDDQPAIDREKFMACWNEYLNQYSKDKPYLYNCLKDKRPIFHGKHTVELVFENRSLEDTFKNEELALKSFLNQRLNNTPVRFKTRVEKASEEEKKKYLVHPKEIYHHMVEKNPQLKMLQQKLGLDLE